MPIIAKTSTEGFRPCIFRNQPVHEFYGHLQAVLKDIRQTGELAHLFARPIVNPGAPNQVEWSVELSGKARPFAELSPEQQKTTARKLSEYLKLVQEYSNNRQNKSGIEKDYADYLAAVAVSPDMKQVYVIGERPVLIHWGFINENSKDIGLKAQDSWQQFIVEVQRQSTAEMFSDQPDARITSQADQPQPAAAPTTAELPNSEVEETGESKPEITETNDNKVEKTPISEPPENDVDQEKPLLACGMGKYVWVKFLAILLAIIILLLLLFRFLPDQTQKDTDSPRSSETAQQSPIAPPTSSPAPSSPDSPGSPGFPASPGSPDFPSSPQPSPLPQPGVDSPASPSPDAPSQPGDVMPSPAESEQEMPKDQQGTDEINGPTAEPAVIPDADQAEPFACPHCGSIHGSARPSQSNVETPVQTGPEQTEQAEQ